MLQSTKSRKRQQQSEQMGFCVHCLKFIPVQQIDIHCLQCLEEHKNQESQVDLITKQLEHIRVISEKGAQRSMDIKEKYQFYIRINELCSQIEAIQSYNILSVKKLEDLHNEIAVLINYQQTSMNTIILLNRLLALIQEKLLLQKQRRLVTQSSFQNSGTRIKTESNYQEDSDSQYQYRKFKTESNIKEASEYKRNFYSKCLEMKLCLSKNDPAQHLLVQDMFSTVIRKNLNYEDAIRYVRKCFIEGKII